MSRVKKENAMTRSPALSREWVKHLSWMLTLIFLGLLTYVPWGSMKFQMIEPQKPPPELPTTTKVGEWGVRALYQEAQKEPLTPVRYARYTWAIRKVEQQQDHRLATTCIGNLFCQLEARYFAKGGERAVGLMRMELDHALGTVNMPPRNGWGDKALILMFKILIVALMFIPVAIMILLLRTFAELAPREAWQTVFYGWRSLLGAAIGWPFGLFFFNPRESWIEAVISLHYELDDRYNPTIAWPLGTTCPLDITVEAAGRSWHWKSPLEVWRIACSLLFMGGRWQRYSARQKAHAIYICLIAAISLFTGETRMAFAADTEKKDNPLLGVIFFSYFSSSGGTPGQDVFLLFRGGYLAAYGYTGETVTLEASVDTGTFRIGKLRSTLGPFANVVSPSGEVGRFGVGGFAVMPVGQGLLTLPWQVKSSANGGIGGTAPDTRLTWKAGKYVRAGATLTLFANPHQPRSLLVGSIAEFRCIGGKLLLDVRAGPWITGPSSGLWELRTGMTYNF